MIGQTMMTAGIILILNSTNLLAIVHMVWFDKEPFEWEQESFRTWWGIANMTYPAHMSTLELQQSICIESWWKKNDSKFLLTHLDFD